MPRHVVIVDDDDLTAKLFTSIASEIPDVKVHAFLSSSEALAWFPGKEVDCFVFDYNMPHPNGLTMIQAVRSMPEFAMSPIVIVTGAHEREVRYRALDAGANDFLQKPVDYRELVARLTTLLALQAAQKRLAQQVGSLETSLSDSEERSRQHAERLEALWRIANDPSLRDDDLIHAMLLQGAAAIRPGQAFRAALARIDGPRMLFESIADQPGRTWSDGGVRTGSFVPVETSAIAETLRSGVGTESWSDVQTSDRVNDFLRSNGWHAMIVTTFSTGGSTYVLSFLSSQPATKPFGALDHTFVELLASFFSMHMQQRWQSSRITHQLEHDSLTGLFNRSRFRSLGRAAFRENDASSIAVFNIVRFHEINETHGHLIGDAVLVEVAAALASVARPEEIVARVGGDSFAIFVPAADSGTSAESVERFAAIFEQGMSTGDRDGRETIAVSACAGVAIAPQDAATFDELLFRAEGRIGAAVAGDQRIVFPRRSAGRT